MDHLLIVGTTNSGKVRQMNGALAGTGIRCVGLADVVATPPHVDETGATPVEVAERKALAYAAVTGRPTISLDHWLSFDEVDPADQPGGNVRRIPGSPAGATDDELLNHYAELARRHGGHLTARWQTGVAVASAHARTGSGRVASASVSVVRTLFDTPSAVRMAGLPLASLQRDPVTGKYVSEHNEAEEDGLWQRAYGRTIIDLVQPFFRA